MRKSCLVPVLAILLFPAPVVAGEIPTLGIKGAKERHQIARGAALKAMAELLPPEAELGDGWRRRGRVRGMLPGDPLGRQDFLDRVVMPVYGQYWGLEKEKIKELVGAYTKQVHAEVKPRLAEAPEPLKRYLATQAGLVSLMLDQVRFYTSQAYQHPQVAVSRLGARREKWMAKQLDAFTRHDRETADLNSELEKAPREGAGERRKELNDRHRKEREALAIEMEMIAYDAFGLDVTGKSLEEVLELHAREATAVRQAAGMKYVWITDEDVKRYNSREPYRPKFAHAEIQVRIMAPDAIGASVLDADEAAIKATAAQMEAVQAGLLEKMVENTPKIEERIDDIRQKIKNMQAEIERTRTRLNKTEDAAKRKRYESRIEELRKEIAESERTIPFLEEEITGLRTAKLKATSRMSDHGDHSWMIYVENVNPSPGFTGSHYLSRLRNGTAIVNIEIKGSMPAEWFRETLERFLGAADEITDVYSMD